MHQNATPLRKSAPSSINISDEHVSCTAPAMRNASLQILSKCPKVFETDKTLTVYSLLGRCKIPCACHANHILTSKSAPRPPLFLLTLLTSTCGLHHNGVHFYNISTSKSAPSMVCFAHFALEMCFPPQRRALFHHVNSQKWSDTVSFFTFYFHMCFAPRWRALFHHLNFQSAPTTLRCFRQAIFHLSSGHMAPHPRPSCATKHWKNTVFRDFSTFSRTCIFFLLTLSLLWLFPPLLFHLSILSEVCLLNFLR